MAGQDRGRTDILEWLAKVELSSPDNPTEPDWGLPSNPNATATTEPQATQQHTLSLFSAPQFPILTPSSSPHIYTQQPPPIVHSKAPNPFTTKQTAPFNYSLMTTATRLTMDDDDEFGGDIKDTTTTTGVLSKQPSPQHKMDDIEMLRQSKKHISASLRQKSQSPLPNPTAEPKLPTFEPSPRKILLLKSSTFSEVNRTHFKTSDVKLIRTSTSPSEFPIPQPKSAPTSPKTARKIETLPPHQIINRRKKSLSQGNLVKDLDSGQSAGSASSGSMDSMRKCGGNTPSSQQTGERSPPVDISPSQSWEDIETGLLKRLESPSELLEAAKVVSSGLTDEDIDVKVEVSPQTRSPLIRQRHTSHSPSPPPPPSHPPPQSTFSPPSHSPLTSTLSPTHLPLSQLHLQRHEKLQGKNMFTFDTTNDTIFYSSSHNPRFLARRSIPSPGSSQSSASHPHKPHTITHPHSVSDYSSSQDSSSTSHGSHVINQRSSSPVYSPPHHRSQSLSKFQPPLGTLTESHEKQQTQLVQPVVLSHLQSPQGVRSGSITQMILELQQKQQLEKALLSPPEDGGYKDGQREQVNRQDSGIGTVSTSKYSL